MSEQLVVELDLDLYDRAAVEAAVEALAAVAQFEVTQRGGHMEVRATVSDARLIRPLRGELMNFALGYTVERRS